MPRTDSLLTLLRKEPVLQALAEAERTATSAIQLDLLDAVLLDDHRKVAQLMEEEDHGRLLQDHFFMCLSVIMVAQAEPKVLRVFLDYGYGGKASLKVDGSASSISMGDIAMTICPLERQQVLVEEGFLKPGDWDYQGMSDARPEVFDYWHEQYVQCEREKLARWGRPGSSPMATLAVYRWMPEANRRRTTPLSDAQRTEMRRRLDKQMAAFLELHYPAQDEQQRWSMMLRQPPGLSCHANDAEGVSMLAMMIQFQAARMDRPPQSLGMPVPLEDMRNDHRAKWTHALLSCGFELDDFDGDLPAHVVSLACDALVSGQSINESLSNLWRTVVSCLVRDDPQRAASLPGEMLEPSFSLSVWAAAIPDDQRPAVAQMLSLFSNTPAAGLSAPRPAPRL